MIISITSRIYLEHVEKFPKYKDRFHKEKEKVIRKRTTLWFLFIPLFFYDRQIS